MVKKFKFVKSGNKLTKVTKAFIKYFSYLAKRIQLKLKVLLIRLSRESKKIIHKIKIDRRYQFATATLTISIFTLVILFIGGLITDKPISPVEDTNNIDNHIPSIITYSVDTPSETPINTTENTFYWPGKDNDPKYITIPSINTDGYIINVGIDQNGAVAVPPNVHLAGWFIDSVRPGQKGLSIIDGHVDGTSTGGIFRHLNELNAGDKFTITMGNGKVLNYIIKQKHTVKTEDAANILFSKDSAIESQLNLITCGGTYLEDQRTYDHRVIVVAELE